MKRIIIATGAVLLASVPVTLGLVGNTSFAQNVPVRVPSQASVLDDHGRLTPHVEPGPGDGTVSDSGSATDDKGGHGGDTAKRIPAERVARATVQGTHERAHEH